MSNREEERDSRIIRFFFPDFPGMFSHLDEYGSSSIDAADEHIRRRQSDPNYGLRIEKPKKTMMEFPDGRKISI